LKKLLKNKYFPRFTISKTLFKNNLNNELIQQLVPIIVNLLKVIKGQYSKLTTNNFLKFNVMLSKKMEEALNVQVEKEAYASALYLAMATWSETQGFDGITEWFYAQAEEEREHMLKFMRYVNERGGHGIVPAVEKPPVVFKDIKSVFEAALEHERMVTASINKIVGQSLEEKDFTTHHWLQWFVEEQLEEESAGQKILDKINLLGPNNLYLLDRDIMAMRAEGGEAGA
jgi:ferritin